MGGRDSENESGSYSGHSDSSLYQCDQCNAICDAYSHLQQHIRKVHIGPRWQCPECSYTAEYSNRPGLRRHLQAEHAFSKEQAMAIKFEQVKPRRHRPCKRRLRRSESPQLNRPKSTVTMKSKHFNGNKNVSLDSSYPSQEAASIINNGENGLRAVWSGTVPMGASITHLAVPQPVIERHFIQTDNDQILVKEVFLFRPPEHWLQFKDSHFEIITPGDNKASIQLTKSATSSSEQQNNTPESNEPTPKSSRKDDESDIDMSYDITPGHE